MTSKDKKDVPAAKAEPLKDADLDQVAGGFFDTGLSGLGVKGESPSVPGSASPKNDKSTPTK